MNLLQSLKNLLLPSAEPLPSGMDELTVILGLLVEAAMADQQLDELERATLLEWLAGRGIAREEAERLLHFALAEQQESTSLHPLTSWVARNLDRPQRLDLLRQLWRVVLADGKLDPWEEALMRKLADLIHMPHSAYIQTKLDVQQALERTTRP